MTKTRLDRKRYVSGDGRALLGSIILIFMWGSIMQVMFWAVYGSGRGFLADYMFLLAGLAMAVVYGAFFGTLLLIKKRRSTDL